jgi:hypothetical protein
MDNSPHGQLYPRTLPQGQLAPGHFTLWTTRPMDNLTHKISLQKYILEKLYSDRKHLVEVQVAFSQEHCALGIFSILLHC